MTTPVHRRRVNRYAATYEARPWWSETALLADGAAYEGAIITTEVRRNSRRRRARWHDTLSTLTHDLWALARSPARPSARFFAACLPGAIPPPLRRAFSRAAKPRV